MNAARTRLTGKRSLRDLGKRMRAGGAGPQDHEALLHFRSNSAALLPRTVDESREVLRDIPGLIAGRVKRVSSIQRKLLREHSMQLDNMDDVVGVRIIVSTPADQEAVSERLRAKWGDGALHDYVSSPRRSGYRALHVRPEMDLQLASDAAPFRHRVEIQIRTYFQHLWSSTSESFGEQVKEGGGPAEVRVYLLELSDRITRYEQLHLTTPQCDIVPHDLTGLAHYAVHFSTVLGSPAVAQPLGSDVASAVRFFGYIEDRTQNAPDKGVVLLATPSSPDQLRVTHLRHFVPRGFRPFPPVWVTNSNARV